MEQRDLLIILYDYYGELLNDYFDNLSLGEISGNSGISRNAIHKHIKSTENKLLFYEEKLKLYEKDKKLKEVIDNIKDETLKEKLKKIFD